MINTKERYKDIGYTWRDNLYYINYLPGDSIALRREIVVGWLRFHLTRIFSLRNYEVIGPTNNILYERYD